MFLLTIHHIISDAWLMRVMVNDLLTLYDSHTNGVENPLKPLRIQYKDYAAWEKQQLAGDKLEEHRQYWLDETRRRASDFKSPDRLPSPACPNIQWRCLRLSDKYGYPHRRVVLARQGHCLKLVRMPACVRLRVALQTHGAAGHNHRLAHNGAKQRRSWKDRQTRVLPEHTSPASYGRG